MAASLILKAEQLKISRNMILHGLDWRGKADSFNIPCYAPFLEELKIEKQILFKKKKKDRETN